MQDNYTIRDTTLWALNTNEFSDFTHTKTSDKLLRFGDLITKS